jgi:hypothetical protein
MWCGGRGRRASAAQLCCAREMPTLRGRRSRRPDCTRAVLARIVAVGQPPEHVPAAPAARSRTAAARAHLHETTACGRLLAREGVLTSAGGSRWRPLAESAWTTDGGPPPPPPALQVCIMQKWEAAAAADWQLARSDTVRAQGGVYLTCARGSTGVYWRGDGAAPTGRLPYTCFETHVRKSPTSSVEPMYTGTLRGERAAANTSKEPS